MGWAGRLVQDFAGQAPEGHEPRAATVRALCTFLVRLSQEAGRVHPALGGAIKQLNHLITGADIAWEASIGPGMALMHPTGVVIGRFVSIGRRCIVQSGVTLGGKGGDRDGHPSIGDDVEVGTGARVLGPVHIADRCVIGANAVVTSSVPADSIAVGVPAVARPRRAAR